MRNKLTIVLGFVEICLEADANGQRPERRFLEGIARATTEAASLLRQVGGAADEPVADPPPSP